MHVTRGAAQSLTALLVVPGYLGDLSGLFLPCILIWHANVTVSSAALIIEHTNGGPSSMHLYKKWTSFLFDFFHPFADSPDNFSTVSARYRLSLSI